MLLLLLTVLSLLLPAPVLAQAAQTVDLGQVDPEDGQLQRVLGSVGQGNRGVPVAGGFDCDGDGFPDTAMAAMTASPLGRNGAGQVFLVFGDGTTQGTQPTQGTHENVLAFIGAATSEAAGSELWMDDVTGDGLGDLLIARQNHDPGGRPGAGALTIVVGGQALRDFDESVPVDLADDPALMSLTLATFVGPHEAARLGIWMRTGDVTGDGIADLVVGADQFDLPAELHRGTAYVIRGGAHLAADQIVDLAAFGTPGFAATGLDGHVARLSPPAAPNPSHFHFGATCQIADLDGNGRAEVAIAAALFRAGAGIPAAGTSEVPHSNGGSTDGTLYIVWDDNFPVGAWPSGYAFDVDLSPGTHSIIDGGAANREFGEELLGGLDYDADGTADLFVGDIVGDLSGQNRLDSGAGHVLYDAAKLAGLVFDLDDIATLNPPVVMTTFLGAVAGDFAADTAATGDFDGDGIADLALSSPHADPLGRNNAGTFHVFFGRFGPWPATIDLAAPPPPSAARLSELYGANGDAGIDSGDVLGYSAAAADLTGDGRDELITNEMLGNGAGIDEGNLILVNGQLIAVPAQIPALPVWGALALASLLGAAGAART